jgi:hypothetical protein
MSRWRAVFGALFVLGLALVLVFCADAVAGKRFVGNRGGVVAAAGVLLMVAGLVGYGTVEMRASGKAWRRLAAQLDRTLESQGFGRAFGVYRGRHVHIQARRTASLPDGLRDVETVIGVTLEPPLEVRFTIHVEEPGGPAARMGAEALEEVVTTGGRRTAYYVTGQRDAYARAVAASPGLRRRLAGLRAPATVRVCDGSITARQSERSGLEREASSTRPVLDVLSDLARAVEAGGES